MKYCVLPLVVALHLVLFQATSSRADDTEIVVIGYGSSSVMPDRATIEIGISTISETAEQAADTNSTLHAKILAALNEVGIDSEHIETSSFTVTPRYPADAGRPDRSQAPIGYSADHLIKVWTEDMQRIGAVIDACLAAGATSTRLSFTSSRLPETHRLAIEDAAKQAKADAEVLAEAVGARLGPLVLLTTHIPAEERDYGFPVGASLSPETSIMPKELRVNARVMGKWKLMK